MGSKGEHGSSTGRRPCRTPGAVFVKAPPRPEVAPPGPYPMFLSQKVGGRMVPSVGHQTSWRCFSSTGAPSRWS
jgi:hypothetical protein